MVNLFTKDSLQSFYTTYEKTRDYILKHFGIDSSLIIPDHLGALTHSSEEFEQITNQILQFSKQIKEVQLHNRRVRVFKFNTSLEGTYPMPKIEIFEPKPEADLSKSRFGVEHISFQVTDLDKFLALYEDSIPWSKKGEVNGSKFYKTETINTVEIEFRSDALGEEQI